MICRGKEVLKENDLLLPQSNIVTIFQIFMEDLELYCTANIPLWRSCVLEAASASKPSTSFGLSAVTVNCGVVIFTKDMGKGVSYNFFPSQEMYLQRHIKGGRKYRHTLTCPWYPSMYIPHIHFPFFKLFKCHCSRGKSRDTLFIGSFFL